MSDITGYEDVYTPTGFQDPAQPTEQRSDYLVRIQRGHVQELEDRARRAQEADARAAAAERRAAFALAGIDSESTDERVGLFVRGYDGDANPEAIRGAAQRFGLAASSTEGEGAGGEGGEGEGGEGEQPGTETPPDTPLEPGEANLTGERRQLAGNAPPDQPAPPDPWRSAQEVHDHIKASGGKEKEALGAAINAVANAAHTGDKSVILATPRGTESAA